MSSSIFYGRYKSYKSVYYMLNMAVENLKTNLNYDINKGHFPTDKS